MEEDKSSDEQNDNIIIIDIDEKSNVLINRKKRRAPPVPENQNAFTESKVDLSHNHVMNNAFIDDNSLMRLSDGHYEKSNSKFNVSDVVWMSMNVGGVTFNTLKSTLNNYPGTLLAELSTDSPFYHHPSGQYWFDRSPKLFSSILEYYRFGDLHFPHSICGPRIKRELDFWGIDDSYIAPCCWSSYRSFSEQEITLDTLGKEFNTVEKIESVQYSNSCLNFCWKVRICLWDFLEDSSSSFLAHVWAILYMVVVLVSIFNLALTTHMTFRVRRSSFNETECEIHPNEKECLIEQTIPHPIIYLIEIVVTSIFGADVFLRFLVCPSKIRFLKRFMNWVDLFVVTSQIALLIITDLPALLYDETVQSVYFTFDVLRITRVILIFKLARYYAGLRILILALKASLAEMMLLAVFMGAAMMFFATLIYHAEFGVPNQFADIPTGFWWAIITITTVGYGDVSPKSNYGFCVGAFCAMSGLLITGLPIPIIANNFTQFYEVQKMKKTMDEKNNPPKEKNSKKHMLKYIGNIHEKIKISKKDLKETDA